MDCDEKAEAPEGESEKLQDKEEESYAETTNEGNKSKKLNNKGLDRHRKTVIRANETEEQKARRRENDRIRRALARRTEPESQRQIRLERDRNRQREARRAETESQRQARLGKDRARKAVSRTCSRRPKIKEGKAKPKYLGDNGRHSTPEMLQKHHVDVPSVTRIHVTQSVTRAVLCVTSQPRNRAVF